MAAQGAIDTLGNCLSQGDRWAAGQQPRGAPRLAATGNGTKPRHERLERGSGLYGRPAEVADDGWRAIRRPPAAAFPPATITPASTLLATRRRHRGALKAGLLLGDLTCSRWRRRALRADLARWPRHSPRSASRGEAEAPSCRASRRSVRWIPISSSAIGTRGARVAAPHSGHANRSTRVRRDRPGPGLPQRSAGSGHRRDRAIDRDLAGYNPTPWRRL